MKELKQSKKIVIRKIKYGCYDHILKVIIHGNVRPSIITQINNTLYYLPQEFQDYVPILKHVEIFHPKQNNGKLKISSTTAGVFNSKKCTIKLYDREWLDELEYSPIFCHELGHLLFEYFTRISSRLDDDIPDPINNFIDEIKQNKVKPVTSYTHELKYKKTDDYNYACELFAEYFGLTYSRYSYDTDAEGTFCNYIKLRHAFWHLIDSMDGIDK